MIASIYVISILIGNLIILKLGPVATPYVAFFIIGLDLVLRDLMHSKISKCKMFSIIVIGGLITFICNYSALQIAIASSVSFIFAAITDWTIFSCSSGSLFSKSNKSNIGGSIIDSILFPTIAFGVFLPWIIIGQIIAKIVGSFIWSYIFFKNKKHTLEEM